jgi:ADP-dependent phosphofructokinase/glucokinase
MIKKMGNGMENEEAQEVKETREIWGCKVHITFAEVPDKRIAALVLDSLTEVFYQRILMPIDLPNI